MGTASNWSLSSGGPANGAIPGNGDDVIFDSNSRATCTLNTNRNCRTLSFTNWTGTIDFNNVFLRIYGSIDCGDALFSITNPGSWQMGATNGVMNGQIIRTNGKVLSGTLSFGYSSGTNPVRLIDDVTCGLLQIQSNVGSPSQPIFTGQTLYTNSISTASNGRNLYTTTPIKLIGTGSIITFNSNAAICCDIEIMTAGNINFNGTVYCGQNCVITYTSANTITSSILYLQSPTTLNTSAMTWTNIYNSSTISGQALNVSNNLYIPTSGTFLVPFTTSNLIMGTGTVTLNTGVTYTVNTNIQSTVSTLAAKSLINCTVVNGTKAILNLAQGATQNNGYLSATDIDSSGGRSIWTYKGVLTRTINWNQMSTNPKKHILSNKGRILKN